MATAERTERSSPNHTVQAKVRSHITADNCDLLHWLTVYWRIEYKMCVLVYSTNLPLWAAASQSRHPPTAASVQLYKALEGSLVISWWWKWWLFIQSRHTVCLHFCVAVKHGMLAQKTYALPMLPGITHSEKFCNSFWRESVKPLLMYCWCLPVPVVIHQRRLLFWKKCISSEKCVLRALAMCCRDSMRALCDLYQMTTSYLIEYIVKQIIWDCFQSTVSA